MEVANLIIWGLVLDFFLAILLIATIIYAVLLNRRLAVLRTDRRDFEEFIQRLNAASQRAESALDGIKNAAEHARRTLNENGERAQALRDELIFLIERGDQVGEKLAVSRNILDEKKSAVSQEQASGQPPESSPVGRISSSARAAERDNMQRSKAEEDLLRALRDVR